MPTFPEDHVEKSNPSTTVDQKKYEAERSGIFVKSREAIKQVDIVISVSNLEQLITEKLPGEKLYYKNPTLLKITNLKIYTDC